MKDRQQKGEGPSGSWRKAELGFGEKIGREVVHTPDLQGEDSLSCKMILKSRTQTV